MRQYFELLREPDDLTEHEKERLVNIKHIPKSVRNMVAVELAKLNQAKGNLEDILSAYKPKESAYPISAYKSDLLSVIARISELENFINGVWG